MSDRARIFAAYAELSEGGATVRIGDWAERAGMSRGKLSELRRHDAALRALPVRGRGRPRKST